MAKEPLPGQVKTRLAKDLGTTAAAWWFRHQLKYILRNLSDPRWELVVSLSPDFFVKRSKFWPSKRFWPSFNRQKTRARPTQAVINLHTQCSTHTTLVIIRCCTQYI